MKSAVEWLIEQCPRINTIASIELIEQSKKMEKQQIIDAHDMGYIDGGNHKKVTAEMYFAETYGGKGSEKKQ